MKIIPGLNYRQMLIESIDDYLDINEDGISCIELTQEEYNKLNNQGSMQLEFLRRDSTYTKIPLKIVNNNLLFIQKFL